MKTDKLLKLFQQKRVMRSGGALPLPKAQKGILVSSPPRCDVGYIWDSENQQCIPFSAAVRPFPKFDEEKFKQDALFGKPQIIQLKDDSLESNINESLGDPMGKAISKAEEVVSGEEDVIDNYRHPLAGMYTAQGIMNLFPEWMQYTGIPQTAGFLGSTGLGIGHELQSNAITQPNKYPPGYTLWDVIREGGEDAFNNMVGAGVGITPFASDKQKEDFLLNAAYNNYLPDGYGKGDMYFKKQGGPLPKVKIGNTVSTADCPCPPSCNCGGNNPIYVTNPNDPRLKAYSDSLTVYNELNKSANFFKNKMEPLLSQNKDREASELWWNFRNQNPDFKLRKALNALEALNKKPYNPIKGYSEYNRNFEYDLGIKPKQKVILDTGIVYQEPPPLIKGKTEFKDLVLPTEEYDMQPVRDVAPQGFSQPTLRMVPNPRFDKRTDALPNRTKQAVVDALGNPRYVYYNGDKLIGKEEYSKLWDEQNKFAFAQGGSLPRAVTGNAGQCDPGYVKDDKGNCVKAGAYPWSPGGKYYRGNNTGLVNLKTHKSESKPASTTSAAPQSNINALVANAMNLNSSMPIDAIPDTKNQIAQEIVNANTPVANRNDATIAPEGSVRSYMQKAVDYMSHAGDAKVDEDGSVTYAGSPIDPLLKYVGAPILQSGVNIANTIMGDRPLNFTNSNDVEGLMWDVVNLAPFADAVVSGGKKLYTNAISGIDKSYVKDLMYSLPQGKLPTYTNAVRWQPAKIPESLAAAGASLTPEQRALTGQWYSYNSPKADPLAFENALGFYHDTRPGPGTYAVNRLSDRQIANLEAIMPASAKGMSGKAVSANASDWHMPGELILPEKLRVPANEKHITFTKNIGEYYPEYIGLGPDSYRPYKQVRMGQYINDIINSNYQPIGGIPRKYFPFEEGGELPKAQWGKYIPQFLNPKNWGVPDYSEFGSFDEAFSGARGNREDQFMWNGNRYTTETKEEEKPNYSYEKEFADYINWLKTIEAKNNWDDKLNKYIIHKDASLNEDSPEGGTYTIGYGHKLQKGEDLSRFYKGITEEEAIQLLQDDVNSSIKNASRLFDKSYSDKGITWDKIDPRQQMLLTDYMFNGSWNWPGFKSAIVDYNLAKTNLAKSIAKKRIAKEYGRNFHDEKGKSIWNKRRNLATINKFLNPIYELNMDMYDKATYEGAKLSRGGSLKRYQDVNSQPGVEPKVDKSYIQVPENTINPDQAYITRTSTTQDGISNIELGSSIPQIFGANITPVGTKWSATENLGINVSGNVPAQRLSTTEGFTINPKKQVYDTKSSDRTKTKDASWGNAKVFGDKSQQFLQGLGYYAPSIQKDFGLNDNEITELMKVAFGIEGKESNFQSGVRYKLKSAFKDTINKGKALLGDDEQSIGAGQIKLDTTFNTPELKALLGKYGITKDNMWDPEISSAAILLLTANNYKTLNNKLGVNFDNTDRLTLSNLLFASHNKGVINELNADFTGSEKRTKKQKISHLLHGDKDWNNDYNKPAAISQDVILDGLKTFSNLHKTGDYPRAAQSFASSLNIDYDKIKQNAQNAEANSTLSAPASASDYNPNLPFPADGINQLLWLYNLYNADDFRYKETPYEKQKGGQNTVPRMYNRTLKLNEIVPQHHKNIVIDNYSPTMNYLIQGDKTYASKKGEDRWMDVSTNSFARKNLYNFLNDKYQMKGYSDYEKEILGKIKSNSYNYEDVFNPKKQEVDVAPAAPAAPAAPVAGVPSQYLWSSGAVSSPKFNQVDPFHPNQKPVVVKKQTSILDGIKSELSNLVEDAEDIYDTAKDAIDVGINKIKRMATLDYGIVEPDDVQINTTVKESDRPLNTFDYYKKYNNASSGLTKVNLPGLTERTGQQIGTGSLDLSTVKFKARNLGDFTPFKSDGLFITTSTPFLRPDDPFYKGSKDNYNFVGVDDNGNFVAGDYATLKNRKDILISRAPLNKVTSFDEDANGISKTKSDKDHGNPRYEVPIINVIDEVDNKTIKKGSLNLLVTPGKEDFYGSVQGGKYVMQNPDTKKAELVMGSLKEIKQGFKRIKGNSSHVNVYVLDNGTYGKGLAFTDNNFTSERLKEYDNLNQKFAANSGGNGLYITGYGISPSKYKEEYYQSPSVRTEKDESFKKGHPLKNEMKKIVLHWTAYSADEKGDWTKADKALHEEFMKPDHANAHMAILANGTRRIYASPEQVTFHAGKSRYDDRDDVNDFAYGIELQNPGNNTGGYAPPLTPGQLESTIEAISKLMDRYNLKLKDVITHKDIRTNYINYYTGKKDKEGNLIIDPKNKAAKPDIDDRMYATIINGLKARGYK